MFGEHAVKNMRTSRTDGETSGLVKLNSLLGDAYLQKHT